jgi:hypothetical protein
VSASCSCRIGHSGRGTYRQHDPNCSAHNRAAESSESERTVNLIADALAAHLTATYGYSEVDPMAAAIAVVDALRGAVGVPEDTP